VPPCSGIVAETALAVSAITETVTASVLCVSMAAEPAAKEAVDAAVRMAVTTNAVVTRCLIMAVPF